LLLSKPPKPFFIAPVIVVNTCVFTVGKWTTFLPNSTSGISIPSGKILSSASSSPFGA